MCVLADVCVCVCVCLGGEVGPWKHGVFCYNKTVGVDGCIIVGGERGEGWDGGGEGVGGRLVGEVLGRSGGGRGVNRIMG